MKTCLRALVLFLVLPLLTNGQQQPASSEAFAVSGAVKKNFSLTIADIMALPAADIGDVTITNHLGEVKSVAKQLKGVPLRKALEQLQCDAENPRQFSEFYLTFIATDGYKAVFSWNEIFNSPTGNTAFLVTMKDGRKLQDMSERILLITPSDEKTGRRYVKGLEKIIVSRVN